MSSDAAKNGFVIRGEDVEVAIGRGVMRAGERRTWRERFMAGEVPFDEIENEVDAWHVSHGQAGHLYDWLGLTVEEYAQFAIYPQAFAAHMERMAKERAIKERDELRERLEKAERLCAARLPTPPDVMGCELKARFGIDLSEAQELVEEQRAKRGG
jgi:hypothetical protein